MLGMTNYLTDCFYLWGQCWQEGFTYVYNAGLKVDAAREILTVVMMSNEENICSCKRHRAVRHVFVFGNQTNTSHNTPKNSITKALHTL